MMAASRPPIGRISAVALVATMSNHPRAALAAETTHAKTINAPAPARVTSAVAPARGMTAVHGPISLAQGVVLAPTGTMTLRCDATAVAPATNIPVAEETDAVHDRQHATTGKPQRDHAAARAAHRPVTLAPAIAAQARRGVAASGVMIPPTPTAPVAT
jgi:hypothetical protein